MLRSSHHSMNPNSGLFNSFGTKSIQSKIAFQRRKTIPREKSMSNQDADRRREVRAQLLRVASVCKLIEKNSSAKRMRASSRGKRGRRVRQPEEIPNRIRGPGFVEFRPRRDASICKCAQARCGIFLPNLSLFSLSLPLHFAFSNWSPDGELS